nr:amidase family protein [Sinobaca sp. H24]
MASGLIPFADGSDMGGSLRFPAAFNNVVGLRPSRPASDVSKGRPFFPARCPGPDYTKHRRCVLYAFRSGRP